MGYRRHFVVAAICTLLAATSAVAWAVNRHFDQKPAPVTVPVDPRPAYCDDPEGEGLDRAGSVAAIFVISTVLSDGKRQAPECSYDLVTRALRGKETRASWKAGNIPVTPFVVDYVQPGYVNSYAVDGSIVQKDYQGNDGQPCDPNATIECYSTRVEAVIAIEGSYEHQPIGAEFLIELVFRGGEWRVDFWQPILQPLGNGPSMVE